MAQGLESLTSPSDSRALIFTIVADGGMGKTTLGSLFPNPVFIRTEDGTQSLSGRADVALFPVAKSVSDVMKAIYALAQEKHGFRTLVIDSITQFSSIAESELIAADGKAKSLNTALGGYGAGYDALASIHRELREACGYLAETKGMHIVFLAHADISSIDLPDQESFMRYTLRIHKKSLSPYVDNVDVVAYIKMRTFTTGDGDKKKAVTDGSRIITCYPTPSHVSKNRLGIKDDLVFAEGVNPFASYIGGK